MSRPRPDTAVALLDAAEALFSERGYAAVGIREIVDRAGANIAAINYHFGSKSGLYLVVVRRAMERRRTVAAWSALQPTPPEPRAAAIALVHFVRRFLDGLLPSCDGDNACNLMLREAIEPTEAIDAVVRDFVLPNETRLVDLVGVLAPDSDPRRRPLFAESILGQILHYRVFEAFLERTSVGDLRRPEAIRRIADHIVRFSLAALGWETVAIDRALREADADADHQAVTLEAPDLTDRNGAPRDQLR